MPRPKCTNCGTRPPRKTRSPNTYNMYVKEQMASDAIKSLPSKERMKAVGTMWKNRAKTEGKE